jgi:alkylresorcinol/alkylpyrone synthase
MDARLVSVATAVPRYAVDQASARDLARVLFDEMLSRDDQRLLAVFDHAGIGARQACMPLEWFATSHSFEEKNALYVEHAVALGRQAASRALLRAGLHAGDVDHIVFVSSTGLAAPSVDARLVNAMGMRADVRRTPIWGLGCAGGAAGLAHARSFALAAPGSHVLLVALELCTLTFQRNDLSKRNLVATSLFGDGAAAAVVTTDAGGSRNGMRHLVLEDSIGTFWHDTMDVMGWEIDGDGLHVVFARDIPTIVHERVKPGLEQFLARHDLTLGTLDHLVAHPGGMKVLAAYEKALGLPATALDRAREVLRDHGNMSSPTCLFVLERALAEQDIGEGQSAILSALGPGFCAEYVLMRGAA